MGSFYITTLLSPLPFFDFSLFLRDILYMFVLFCCFVICLLFRTEPLYSWSFSTPRSTLFSFRWRDKHRGRRKEGEGERERENGNMAVVLDFVLLP